MQGRCESYSVENGAQEHSRLPETMVASPEAKLSHPMLCCQAGTSAMLVGQLSHALSVR